MNRRFTFAPPARLGARGFTLVELLVVIAVVAMLAGVLVPALRAGAAASRSAACRSNLRQLFLAAETYSQRSAGRYPVAVRYEQGDEGFETIAWDWRHAPDEPPSPGPLWGGVDPDRVQQCPDCTENSTFGDDPFTGYNYNTTFIGGEAVFPNLGWASVRPGLPRTLWRRTTETAVFGDGGWKGGANKFMRAPLNTVEGNLHTVYAGGQAFRHRGRTNVAYLDGHVGAVGRPRKGELATDALLADVMAFPQNGFLSDDDSAYDPR